MIRLNRLNESLRSLGRGKNAGMSRDRYRLAMVFRIYTKINSLLFTISNMNLVNEHFNVLTYLLVNSNPMTAVI